MVRVLVLVELPFRRKNVECIFLSFVILIKYALLLDNLLLLLILGNSSLIIVLNKYLVSS